MRPLEAIVRECLDCYAAEKLPNYPYVAIEAVLDAHREEYEVLEGEVRRGEIDDDSAETVIVESISTNLDRWAYRS